MAYEPKTWECGDTITAEDLNHIENGIAECCGGGTEPLILREVTSGKHAQLDKTFGEIKSAFNSGRPIWFVTEDDEYGVEYAPNITALYISTPIGGVVHTEKNFYYASTDEDYPQVDR